MVAIFHETLRGSHFLGSLQFLKGQKWKFSASIKPQMIFDSTPTPLAISIQFLRDETSLDSALLHSSEIQRGFRHCVAIIVTRDAALWQSFNLRLRGGHMRLHWVHDQAQCVELTASLYQELSTPESQRKLKAQAEFFANEKSQLRSEVQASGVYRTTMESLGISSSEDISILCDGFPTLAKLVAADICTLHNSSPVSRESLNCLFSFFHAAAPDCDPALSAHSDAYAHGITEAEAEADAEAGPWFTREAMCSSSRQIAYGQVVQPSSCVTAGSVSVWGLGGDAQR